MDSELDPGLLNELAALQRRIVESQARVLLVFEGRSGRVIGRVANEFMNLLEPRGTTYNHFCPDKRQDTGNSRIMEYLRHEPANGKIAIYDRSWYSNIMYEHMKGMNTDDMVRNTIAFEKYYVHNDVILVKVFLDIDDGDLDAGKRFRDVRINSVSFLNDDHIGSKKFDRKHFKEVRALTDTDEAPWDVIEATEINQTVEELVKIFMGRVIYRMKNPMPESDSRVIEQYPNPRKTADLSLVAEHYNKKLKDLSLELYELQNLLAASDRSMVLVFEGWDAAGKGGSIRRVTRALNPRGYEAVPTAAPIGDEKLHSYLWRFSQHMPRPGHIVIFDRSWYGRMMVEPIEGFCTEEEYNRSAWEIKGFERVLAHAGCIVLKFWMEVSNGEQLRRFQARQDNPLKNWKITDEDWRNREKWDQYEEYVNRMIASTNISEAPWIVVESEDKKYARLKVLQTIVDTLKRELA